MTQFLRMYGEQLVELGYTVLPIRPGTKRPDIKDWPRHATTVDDVRAWYSNGRAQHGVGINARNTPAIDVDVLDPEVAQAMSDAIDEIFPGVALMTRTGLAPKFLIPFRSDEPFRKLSSATYTDGQNDHKVEILGDGQQWVAYHVHPDSGNPYAWFDGIGDAGIRDVASNELPRLTRMEAQRVIDAFEVLAAAKVSSGAWWAVIPAAPDRDARPLADDPFLAETHKTDLTTEQVKWLLNKCSSHDYKRWIDVGMALHHQFEASDEGFALWDEWSAESENYSSDVMRTHWDSFGHRTDAPLTMKGLLKEFGQPPKPQEPTEADKNFRFHAGDSYSADFTGGPEIVEDVLPAQGIAMMYGPSGKGKTFWMLDLAFHVHNGERWRDKDVAKGDVMYVAAEAGRGIKKRVQAVKVLHPEWRAPFIADAAPNLSSLTSVQAVRDAARAVGSPAMVVIDTMSASFEGDDSSQKDVAQMMRNLKVLADDLQCLVVFVHHTTKEGGSWRGSGVLFADVDAVLELVSEGEGTERKQWVTQRKHREGEDGKSYPFTLRVSEPLAHKANGKPITSCTVEHEDRTVKSDKSVKADRDNFYESPKYAKLVHMLGIIRELIGLGDENVDESDVISAIQADETVNPLKEPDHPKASNIKRQLLTLADKGKIRREGRWIRVCE